MLSGGEIGQKIHSLGAVGNTRIVGGWVNRDLDCKKPQEQFVLPQGPKQSSRQEVHQGIQMVVSIGVQHMIQQHHSGAQLPPLNTATKHTKSASTQTPQAH